MRIRNGFEDLFCLRSNLSNDNSFLKARPENGCGKLHFFGLKSGQDLENRAAHPYQEFPRILPRAFK